MKLLIDIKYEGNKAEVTYEEDGNKHSYLMVNERGEWHGDSVTMDRFFRPLLKEGDL